MELVLLEDKTVEFKEGYMFYWDSKNHALDGMTDRILGNNPVIVNKKDKSLYITGYSRPDVEIQQYK